MGTTATTTVMDTLNLIILMGITTRISGRVAETIRLHVIKIPQVPTVIRIQRQGLIQLST